MNSNTAKREPFIPRFNAMVDALRAAGCTITHLWVGPPVSEATVAEVEAHLGHALDDSIKNFFREADGLQLRWTEDPESETPAATVTTRTEDLLRSDDPAEGLVNILPMHQLFIDEDYEGRLYYDWMKGEEDVFAGAKYELQDFFRAIRPFDDFSGWSAAAFFLGAKATNPPVLLGDGHNARFTNSRVTDFATYLAQLLAHKGAVEGRATAFKESGGSEQPPLCGVAELVEVERWWAQPAPPVWRRAQDQARGFKARTKKEAPTAKAQVDKFTVPVFGSRFYEADLEAVGGALTKPALSRLMGEPVVLRAGDPADDDIVGALVAIDKEFVGLYNETDGMTSTRTVRVENVTAVGVARFREQAP